ncbi:glutathione S-transferase family protein [Actinobacillus equuli subsp. haemolyticus]|uniref:glutathione S-transferase family protein n=1 Tax=Actinobacillus equuli TaxID=718 RepID=UPI0024467586|nr:glutathione S-transferase family protein [Actinobacillus equuli]WGE50965.1 glutathione S-transferase family protein [Actinobacillus equuli subsp. haemolyticus]
MYQLYINPPKSSWSLRPWILLKMLNIPFEPKIVRYLSDINEQRQQFSSFSATAKIPVLYDNEIQIWDSLAITEYVAESYPHVWPKDKKARAWARSVCAEMHSGFEYLRNICDFRPLEKITLEALPCELEYELKRLNAIFAQGLQQFGGTYLAGMQFTAVDAFLLPIAARIQTYGLADYFDENVRIYQQQMLALPAYQEWLKG